MCRAGCPASLQGLQMVILTQERPRTTSACPEGWELPSQRPHFVTPDATNLDDCVEGMGQFLRMEEVGPKELPSSSGDREWLILFAKSPPHNSLQSIFFLLHLALFQIPLFLHLSSLSFFQSLLFVLWNYSSHNFHRQLPGISSLMNSSVWVCLKY